jgi:CheY-like chemotaxis protein
MNGKKKILLVDDDHAVLALLTAKLSKRYDVVSTLDPHEAVALARSLLPDLILCDIDMPGLNGGEVAAKLSHDGMTSRIPLVYLTSLVSPEESQEIMVSGRPAMSKQATVAELVDCIDQLTSR